MPTGDAVSWKWYQYEDDDGGNWSVRVDKTWGDDADSGLAAFDTADPVLNVSGKRSHPRFVILIDLLTGRTKRKVVGTPAAMAAITGSFTQTFKEPGLAGNVTYSFKAKVKERIQTPGGIYNMPEPSTA